jgi:uncharacterized membrane protein YjgN (DUF898 family)
MTDTNAPSAPQPAGEPLDISWAGSPWSLAGLGFINFLLSLVTLGIYSFWGRAEVRRRLWSSVRLNGEPLEYTGTGKELFLGFIVVFLLVLLPLFAVIFGAPFLLTWLLGPETAAVVAPIIVAVGFLLFYALIGVAVYRAYRYRLSRTRWRGIRGALVGSSTSYGWHYFWTLILLPFTLGWLFPWRTNMLARHMTNDMRFGESAFRYTGKAGPLYPPFVMAWVGVLLGYLGLLGGVFLVLSPRMSRQAELEAQGLPPEPLTIAENAMVMGVVLLALFVMAMFASWYFARLTNHLANHTAIQNARFNLKAKPGGLLWQMVSNYLITALSFTILAPVAQARFLKYMVDRLRVDGTIDPAAIAQSKAALDKRGEGLATAFDVDAF